MAEKKARAEPEEKKPAKQDAKPAEKKPAKRIAWDKIKAEYLVGDITLQELAEKHHISLSTLYKKASSDGWKKGRQEVGRKVAGKMATRAARAREEKALKGINLAKYIADVWTDNLKSLNTLIQNTPEYMLTQPSFAANIPRGLRETYELIMEMNGRGYINRKLANEERKLKLEREKFELEKRKWEAQKAAMERGAAGGEETIWQVTLDDGEVEGNDE